MQFMPIGPTSDRESTDVPSDQEYVTFYVAYGECFAAWSQVELQLFAVYAYLMAPAEYAPVSASYFSTVGFRAKLELVDAVLKNGSTATALQREKWGALYDTASKRSRRRNELAHNVVYFGRLEGKGEKKMFIGGAQNPGQRSRLHAHDLFEIQQSFNALCAELFEFWQEFTTKGRPT